MFLLSLIEKINELLVFCYLDSFCNCQIIRFGGLIRDAKLTLACCYVWTVTPILGNIWKYPFLMNFNVQFYFVIKFVMSGKCSKVKNFSVIQKWLTLLVNRSLNLFSFLTDRYFFKSVGNGFFHQSGVSSLSKVSPVTLIFKKC